MKRLNRLWIVLAILFGAGCANRPEESMLPLDDVSPSPSPVSTTQEDFSPVPPADPSTPQNLIENATQDLARRFSLPATEITLVEAQSVTWPDSSLGCPQEGFAYSQVLTPGYLIVLEYANNRYEYHAGSGPDVIYCPNPQPPVPNPDNT